MKKPVELTLRRQLGRRSSHRAYRKVVWHAMREWIWGADGRWHSAWNFLHDRNLSAHVFVTPSGVIVRQVADELVADHAGPMHNFDSLGVEVLVSGCNHASVDPLMDLYAQMRPPWVTPAQYQACVWLGREWTAKHPGIQHVQHSTLNQNKRDPGRGFPWHELMADLSGST